ncbi:MAG: Wzz/FepE/Etk N-terminal domain-containing protein [Rikenellaceae bacterium]|nr:Wzz/FepE/Etk N-terminal domain-containing protein [Rikenellaceae bacterium]
MENERKEDKEIDLLDLSKKIWEKRRFVIKIVLIALVVGVVIILSKPGEYTSYVKMAHEGGGVSSGVSDLISLTGLSKNNNTEGVNFSVYPDIISSTPFVVEMSRIPVKGRKMDQYITLYDYVENDLKEAWWTKIMAWPGKIIGGIISIFKGAEEEDHTELNPYSLTKKQSGILKGIGSRINVSLDSKTGLITASAQMQDPQIAAQVVDSLTVKLENYVVQYKTNKAVKDLQFTTELYEDSKAKYLNSHTEYAMFIDGNQHLTRVVSKIEEYILAQEKDISLGLYRSIAQQLDLAKIKVQEQTPVVTIIEPASVPVNKSGMSKIVMLGLFGFLGLTIAIGVILIKEMIKQPANSVD